MKRTIVGVDFSGARLAGRTAWLARAEVVRGLPVVRALAPLEELAGGAERTRALAWLVDAVRTSEDALWGIDAPFALPVELFEERAAWRAQLAWVRGWEDAPAMGRHLAKEALARFGVMHVRRETDRAMKTPFDCYHYRIVHQTFHAMRDVLAPLAKDARTAIAPFQYAKLACAARVVLETCPSSTLRRLGAPYRMYKQPAGGTVTRVRARVRRAILAAIAPFVRVSASHARRALADPGGDALDALVAVAGTAWGWANADHAAIARHPRAPREGWVYA